MHYSRAGLVVIVITLIISLVSAIPIIPATESRLSSTSSPPSNPSLNGQDHIQLDTTKISEIPFSGRMSTLPLATRLTRRQIPTDTDDQLVRRNIFDNIKNAFQSFGNKVKEGFQKVGGAIKDVAQKVGNGIKTAAGKVKEGFQKAGSAIKSGFQKVGGAIKNVAQKVGNGIKTAANKVWDFAKTTGAKAVKFGLKVYQSVGTVVAKVANFIPAIGKPIDKAIEGATKIAGFVSDHINVKLPGNLEKGMEVMNKANEIMDYIPRRREFSEEQGFQQRDIGEAYHFVERDDIALENREESYFEADERDFYERYYDLDQE